MAAACKANTLILKALYFDLSLPGRSMGMDPLTMKILIRKRQAVSFNA